ncbi:hypothetical protein Saga11_19620 [Bacillus safensis]|nr:hypothetical protein Saga11_19620 [Bacillus safensis]
MLSVRLNLALAKYLLHRSETQETLHLEEYQQMEILASAYHMSTHSTHFHTDDTY